MRKTMQTKRTGDRKTRGRRDITNALCPITNDQKLNFEF
jgi:hypothetical protein